jgi:hypothetical protein
VRQVPPSGEAPFLNTNEMKLHGLTDRVLDAGPADAGDRRDVLKGEFTGTALPTLRDLRRDHTQHRLLGQSEATRQTRRQPARGSPGAPSFHRSTGTRPGANTPLYGLLSALVGDGVEHREQVSLRTARMRLFQQTQ